LRGDPDWFSVGFSAQGEAVGYVAPALADDFPVIAEIGVAAGHRGQGYVDDLLSWATELLAALGPGRIVADTDRANAPMRAAFQRAGYGEFRWRDDYEWRHSGDGWGTAGP
jgi:RimJ/RimL family protein N-acetyltransferase